MFKLFPSKAKWFFEKNDDELMMLIQKGDHKAFSDLFHRHFSKCYSIAYRFLGSVNDSEDVVQIVFLKIWNNPSLWKDGHSCKVSTWIYRIITNNCLNLIRDRKPQCEINDATFKADMVSCEEQFIRTEEQSWMEEAMLKLPINQRVALNLCFYEGLTNKEASQVMGLTIKAVQSLLMRAKQNLKEMRRECLEYDK